AAPGRVAVGALTPGRGGEAIVAVRITHPPRPSHQARQQARGVEEGGPRLLSPRMVRAHAALSWRPPRRKARESHPRTGAKNGTRPAAPRVRMRCGRSQAERQLRRTVRTWPAP